MKDKASSVKVGVADNNLTRGGHILHEQEYNTGHGVSAIPDEVRGEIRRQPRQSEVQQEPVVYLLLEDALEWKCGISGLPIQTSAPSPEPAHRGRAESYPEYAAKESHAWNDRTVAAASQTGLYPLPGKPVPSYAQTGDIPADKGQNTLQAKTIRADAVSRPACAGGYESGTAEMPGKSGRTVISVYSD